MLVNAYSSGGRDSTIYDAAGSATAVVNRRNRRVSMTYDLLGRMLTRDVPADETYAYPSPNFTPSQGLELVPYGLTRPAETQVFTYHPSGQISSANALDANVVRTYHASGALLTDTLKIRDSSRATIPHVFSLSYTYDRNGRRLSRTLGPSSLFSGSPMTYAYNFWGALASITDIAGNTYSFAYNDIGELQTTTLPANITRTLGYDGAGRLSSDVITNSNTASTGFPYDLQTAVRNFTITKRNARGQILSATDPTLIGGPIPSLTYDSAGFLVKSDRSQRGYVLGSGGTPTFVANDTMAYDGLGNILSKQGAWSLLPNYATYTTTNTYNSAGRLSVQNDSRTSNGGGSSSRYSSYAYDASGNTRFEVSKPSSGATSNSGERASYYGADDRLIGTDVRSTGKRMLEEYRYDALGRRVWVSKDQGCAPTSDLSCVTDGPTRTVWDGSDEVAEIKAPLGASNGAELNSGFPLIPWSVVGDPNPFYGRVVYAPGLTVDQPLSVTRYDYRDNPSGGVSATWPTFTLMPFWDYRGTPVYGVTTDGATAIPLNPGGTSCPNPGVATTTRCVLLSWNFAADAYRQESGNLLTLSWHGSVLQNKKDGSGLQYMRNRVYDPGTGRFTQEDPIGLAGGMNAYGFATGDPVNGSDPFGLCPGGASKSDNGQCPSSGIKSGDPKFMHEAGLDAADPLSYLGGLGELKAGMILAGSIPVVLKKAINLPAWRTIGIDIAHIASGHMLGGARVSAAKTLFPTHWSEAKVERVVRAAYRMSSKVGSQGERVLMQGDAAGLTIEMWVNKTERLIETAYPIIRR